MNRLRHLQHLFLWRLATIGVLGSSSLVQAQRAVDAPVERIEVTANGVLRAGFMYWYSPSLFLTPSDMVLRGTVVKIDARESHQPEVRSEVIYGRIRVSDVVLCPARLHDDAQTIRFLEADGFDGLAIGDEVLVFMLPYEAQYAIPSFHNTNCAVGVKLPEDGRGIFQTDHFKKLLVTGHAWELDSLSVDDLRQWAQVDPGGIAEALIRERATGECECGGWWRGEPSVKSMTGHVSDIVTGRQRARASDN